MIKEFVDSWDKAFLGENYVSQKKYSKFSNLSVFKNSVLKTISVVSIILISNLFFLKNAESILIFYDNFKNQISENYNFVVFSVFSKSAQLAVSANLAAVSLQETTLNLQNQVLSLSLSLSLS